MDKKNIVYMVLTAILFVVTFAAIVLLLNNRSETPEPGRGTDAPPSETPVETDSASEYDIEEDAAGGAAAPASVPGADQPDTPLSGQSQEEFGQEKIGQEEIGQADMSQEETAPEDGDVPPVTEDLPPLPVPPPEPSVVPDGQGAGTAPTPTPALTPVPSPSATPRITPPPQSSDPASNSDIPAAQPSTASNIP